LTALGADRRTSNRNKNKVQKPVKQVGKKEVLGSWKDKQRHIIIHISLEFSVVAAKQPAVACIEVQEVNWAVLISRGQQISHPVKLSFHE